jgi:galactose mutarotase-like enzyme
MLKILKYNNTTITINSKGAELIQIEKDSKSYIWDIDTNYWNKTSPVLFPIVGMLINKKYQYNDIEYNLERHGFAREYEFTILEEKENKVVFSLQSNEETLKIYPFTFELWIIYILNEKGLIIEYQVNNLSNSIMPFSLGAHPAFKIEGNFEDYSLEFETDEKLETYHLQNELQSGETSFIRLEDKQLRLNYDWFKNDAIILKDHPTSSLKLLKNNELVLKINFKDFPYLGIWTKKDAPFICIEPWVGIADSIFCDGNIFEKEGIQLLKPMAVFTREIVIEI